jgi:ubiquinone/menaquinone biosynthesis C-methylase UbiE
LATKNIGRNKKEVEFICRALNLTKKIKILDLACGPGRHAVELAKKRFNVTCLDFNRQFLDFAKRLAKQNKVSLRVVQSDMGVIPYKNEFDAVINIFSSFGYFKKEKENLKVLKAVSKALKLNGLFLLDLPNKNWLLVKAPKKTWQKIKNNYILEERSFDKKRKVYLNNITIITSDKKMKYTNTLMRLYDLSEIRRKLSDLGFKIIKVYGNYKNEKFIKGISPRMIILAQLKLKKL